MQKIGAENPGNELFLPYISDNVLNKEEYAIVFRNNIKRTYLKMNYSEEKAQKKARKMKDNNLNRATVKEHCIENVSTLIVF